MIDNPAAAAHRQVNHSLQRSSGIPERVECLPIPAELASMMFSPYGNDIHDGHGRHQQFSTRLSSGKKSILHLGKLSFESDNGHHSPNILNPSPWTLEPGA